MSTIEIFPKQVQSLKSGSQKYIYLYKCYYDSFLFYNVY